MHLDDLDLDEDTRSLRAALRQFVAAEVAPRARELDREGRFPREAMEALGGLGFLGIVVPAAYGGVGGTKLQYAIAVEEIARACGTTSVTFMTQAHGALPLLLGGSEEQRHRWLPGLAAGTSIGAIALTEPHAGSDVAAMRTTARPTADGYVLRGNKIFITNGGEADQVCVFAVTDPDAGTRGLSAFVVDTTSPGYGTGPPLAKMGLRGSNTVEVVLDDVEVGADRRLGPEGGGFGLAMRTLDLARLSTAAQAVGIGQGAYDRALDYALRREQFGRPIFEHQAVQFRLVDMHVALRAARAATHQIARLLDHDPEGRHRGETALVKVLASDTAMRVTTDAVQCLGGYGYMEEYEVERFMRDAKVTQIYDGTNDINRMIIGRELAAAIRGSGRAAGGSRTGGTTGGQP